MAKKSIKTMTLKELQANLSELKDSFMNFRFQKSLQQLEHPQKLKHIKKEIARVKTYIKEYELGLRGKK